MSITNYGELKTSIESWSHRDDLTSVIPDFITIAEARIANDIRCRAQETRSTATLSTEYVDIPDDFLEIRDIAINSDPIQPLRYLSPKALSEKFPSSTTGKPKFYTIIGDEFQVKPVPSTSYTIEISYFARFASMNSDTDYNWLLRNHPHIYLYASLTELFSYVEDEAKTIKYLNMYQEYARKLNDSERMAKHGNQLTSRINTAVR